VAVYSLDIDPFCKDWWVVVVVGGVIAVVCLIENDGVVLVDLFIIKYNKINGLVINRDIYN
jgi:hypothetical protein